MRILALLMLSTVFAFCGPRAFATPILYSETVDGPLSPSAPLTMGVGTNVVIGSACWTSRPGCATFNNFVFNIAPGTALVGYRYIFGNLAMASSLNGISPAANWTGRMAIRNLDDPSFYELTQTVDWLLGDFQTLIIDNLFAPSGVYRQFYSAGRNGEGGLWDFRIELDVIAVDIPLPATILFFSLGLGAVGIFRRRF